ncbi:MAG: glycosyltransferase family 39 protein [Dehalococcoidia bacterium]
MKRSVPLKLVIEFQAILAALIISIVVMILSYTEVIAFNNFPMGLALMVGALVYAAFRTGLNRRWDIPRFISGDAARAFRILAVIVVIVCIVELLLMNSSLYSRPFAFFFLMTFGYLAIALQILLPSTGKGRTAVIIAEILLLSIILRASIFYISPGFHSSDSWTYSLIPGEILDSGTFGELWAYKIRDYPPIGITPAFFMSVTGLGVKDAFFISIIVPYTISTIFVYLIGKKLHSREVGLLAILLLNIATLFMVRSVISLTPSLIVLPCMLAMVYLLLQYKGVRFTLLAYLLMFIIIASHQASAVMAFTVVTGLIIGSWIYRRITGSTEGLTSASYTFVILFGIGIIGYWLYSEVDEGWTVFARIFEPLIRERDFGYSGPTYSFGVRTDLVTSITWQLGHLGLIALGAVGLLIWTFHQKASSAGRTIAFTVIIVTLIVYGNMVIGLADLRPTRWAPILTIFLCLLSAAAILNLTSLPRRRFMQLAIFVPVIVFLAFFNVTAPNINYDSPMYAHEMTLGLYTRESEQKGFRTVYDHVDEEGPIIADYNLRLLSRLVGKLESEPPFRALTSDEEYTERGSIILLREGRRVVLDEFEYITMNVNDEVIESYSTSQYGLIYRGGNLYGFSPL